MGDTPKHDEQGLPKVYPSARPHGTTTYFTGSGDVAGISDGPRLLFLLTATDVSKQIDITFNTDVWIKDGFMIVDNAPFGAYLDIEIVHPVAGVVGSFGRKVPIFGSGWFPMNTDDRAKVTAGLIIRLTVYNSDSSDGVQDAPAEFRVAGRIELFRDDV